MSQSGPAMSLSKPGSGQVLSAVSGLQMSQTGPVHSVSLNEHNWSCLEHASTVNVHNWLCPGCLRVVNVTNWSYLGNFRTVNYHHWSFLGGL